MVNDNNTYYNKEMCIKVIEKIYTNNKNIFNGISNRQISKKLIKLDKKIPENPIDYYTDLKKNELNFIYN